MAEVEYIKTVEEFDALVADTGSKALIIDFTATWCPPCQRIGPVFQTIANERAADMTFRKVDVDAAAPVAQKAGIACMPTFKVYKGGAEVAKLEGASEQGIKDLIDNNK